RTGRLALALLALAFLVRRAADEPAEDAEDDEHAARLRDQAGNPAVGEDEAQPCESTHRPPTVKRTISTSTGYCVHSAIRAERNSPTARSCATASPTMCPVTSATTWTYQIMCGVRNVKFGWKPRVPNRSQPRP